MMASGENLVNEERSMNKEPSSPCACSGGNGQQTACASEQASTETTVFHVSNMDCRNEEALVRRTLEGMPGVERLLFDLPQRLLTISHREVSADALEQALNSVGMKAQAVRDAAVSTTYRIENMDCPSEEKLIRSHLGAVEGIQDLDFDLAERTLSVKHLAQARAQMEQVLASIGMRAKEQTFGHTGPIEAAAVIPSSALQQQPTAAVSAPPIGERVTYRIENMDCPTEEALIRDRLGKLPGVTALDFNLMQRVLGVQHTLATSAPIEKALASIGMQAARQDMQTATTVLRIAKMDCPTEESLIRGKLQGMPGVQGMDFNLMQRTLTVRHTPDAIKPAVEAIESLGMEAEVQRTDEPRDAPVAAHKTNWWPMAVSGVAAVAAEGVYWVNDGNHWAVIVLALVSIFTGGLSTYKKGWIALKNLNLNMNALMAIAVTGGMAIGHWPEAAMVMFLFALAEVIEAKSLDRARNAIRGLMDLAPETATVRQADGSWTELPAKEVAKGAVVRVRPGERIALDGLITSGRSAINQAPITGESLPVEKAEGDQVFAGTINETGSFEYKVTAGASDSTLARIIHAVESAQGSRAPTQRFVDQFARVYTPAVFAVSVLVAVVPPLAFGGAWFDWVYKALVLLVIACPCALVISTPVTIVSGLAAAARRGILIKGGVYLEGGRKLKALALDKTGTLTHGKPEQTDFVPLIGEAQEVAAWAASLAARSDHPVSQAIARKANRDGIALHEVDDFAAAFDYVLTHQARRALQYATTQGEPELRAQVAARMSRQLPTDAEHIQVTSGSQEGLFLVGMALLDPGDVVLDPFFGTGTTGAVAKRLGRRFVGIERDAGYAEAARARIDAVVPLGAAALELVKGKRAEPRIPFGALIETGLIEAGEILFDGKGRHLARVRIDGSLEALGHTGSIHRVGALVQGAEACNGWTYWYASRDGRAVVLDDLRKEYRTRHGDVA